MEDRKTLQRIVRRHRVWAVVCGLIQWGLVGLSVWLMAVGVLGLFFLPRESKVIAFVTGVGYGLAMLALSRVWVITKGQHVDLANRATGAARRCV